MIKAEAKRLADEIYADVIGLCITQDKTHRVKIARLVAENALKISNNGLWVYVVNELNERLL